MMRTSLLALLYSPVLLGPRLILIAVLSVCPLAAQVSISGSVRGRITDPSRSQVANAALTLTNVETNATQSAASGPDGYYAFPRVAPGRYSLAAERTGFRRAVRDNLAISVNEAISSDLELTLGDARESVTVESAAPLVQGQSVELSGLVGERLVKELPLNGRNFQELVLLAPGVGGQSGTVPNNPSIGGARPVNNTYTIDGLGSNDERPAVGFAGLSNGSGTDLGDSVPRCTCCIPHCCPVYFARLPQ